MKKSSFILTLAFIYHTVYSQKNTQILPLTMPNSANIGAIEKRQTSTNKLYNMRMGITITDIVDQFTGEKFSITKAITKGFNTNISDKDVDNIVYFKIGDDFYKRDGQLTVKNFGVCHQGADYDDDAINAALKFSRDEFLNKGICPPLFFPSGTYKVHFPINATRLNGITIAGMGGRYINTIIQGDTGPGNPVIDLTGSREAEVRDLTVTNTDKPSSSTIGVLFALGMEPANNITPFNQVGGLNNKINNMYIQMLSDPTANGGIGRIAIANIRSEEFSIANCTIQADVGYLFANSRNMTNIGIIGSYKGHDYEITSQYTDVAKFGNDGSTATTSGSMGVIDIYGQNSILGYGTNHAIILATVNNLRFHGYVTAINTSKKAHSNGDAAVGIYGLCQNIQYMSNIEGFSTAIQLHRAILESSKFDLLLANSNRSDITDYPVINLADSSSFSANEIKVCINNVNAWQRYIVSAEKTGSTEMPLNIYFTNNTFSCKEISEPHYMCPNNLMKVGENNIFNCNQSFKKEGAWVYWTQPLRINLGLFDNPIFKSIAAFTNIEPPLKYVNYGGFYKVKIEGVLKTGNYISSGTATTSFIAEMVLNRNGTAGNYEKIGKTITLINKSEFKSGGSINDIDCDLVKEKNIWVIKLKGSGPNATGEELWFTGNISVMSDFAAGQAVPTTIPQ